MRHRVSGRKLSRPTGHRMLMLRSMATDLIKHESIRTTEAKAKEVRKLAEKMITLGKKGSLHHRRQALTIITEENVVKKIFEDLPSRYESRPGGYTRVTKLGERKGDAASMAMVELIP